MKPNQQPKFAIRLFDPNKNPIGYYADDTSSGGYPYCSSSDTIPNYNTFTKEEALNRFSRDLSMLGSNAKFAQLIEIRPVVATEIISLEDANTMIAAAKVEEIDRQIAVLQAQRAELKRGK